MRRRAGAPGDVSVVPARRGGKTLGRRFRGGGSLSARAVLLDCSSPLRVVDGAVALWRRSPSRGAHGAAAHGAALALLAPYQSCRRTRGGVALGRRSRGGGSLSARALRCARQRQLQQGGANTIRSINSTPCPEPGLRVPERAARKGSPQKGKPSQSCRRCRGGATSAAASAAAARSRPTTVLDSSISLRVIVGAVASLLSSRRCAARTAPLIAAPRLRSWRPLSRAAA